MSALTSVIQTQLRCNLKCTLEWYLKCNLKWNLNYTFLCAFMLIAYCILRCSLNLPSGACSVALTNGPHSLAFGLNTERHGVSLSIMSECRKMWTRITPNTDTFHAVYKVVLYPGRFGMLQKGLVFEMFKLLSRNKSKFNFLKEWKSYNLSSLLKTVVLKSWLLNFSGYFSITYHSFLSYIVKAAQNYLEQL